MVTDGGLACVEFVHQVTGAHLLAGEQAHDLRAKRITEQLHGSLGYVRVRVRRVG
nr:hypothetical protein [Kibdelosporangium sp. MJ126-NF4]CTQ90633.1 hypothetical protein [Kibdelosporangium sp. MJ126-NF4]